MRDDREPLAAILKAADQIGKFTSTERAIFDSDEVKQAATVMAIQIIGDAADDVSSHTRDAHPDVDWPDLVDRRNRYRHRYWETDLDEVWSVARRDVPRLIPQIKAILAALPGEQG
jgi:uncharacterized protein with HEPN domain